MKNWKSVWKNTVFRKLVIMLLLIMVPIYSIGFIIYNWGFQAINNDINKSINAQISFYVDKMELEIQRIRILQYDCLTDNDLNKLVYIPRSLSMFDKAELALRFQKRIFAIKNSSQYIKDVKVSIPEIRYTISADKGVGSYNDNERGAVDSAYISKYSQITYWNNDFHIVNYYKSKYQDKILFWIDIVLSKTALDSDLSHFNTFEDSISMFYIPSNDIFITDSVNSSNYVGNDLTNSIKEKLQNSKSGAYQVSSNNIDYLAFYMSSDYLGLVLIRYIPEDLILRPVKSYQIWLWAFLVTSIIAIIIFSIYIRRSIHKPLNIILESFKKVGKGDLSQHIEHNHNDEFKYLYIDFNNMVSNLAALLDQVYKQKILTKNAELKQLQAQINPHFLYNIFQTLYSIANSEDNQTLMVFLDQLGSYFKYITRNISEDVALLTEVEHAKTYANIQSYRFLDRCSIHIDELPDKFRNFPVPRLMMQPIIENAFKYGIESRAGEGIITVKFYEAADKFSIIIDDSGNGLDDNELHRLRELLSRELYAVETTGIVNIHKRLQIKYGENSGLTVSHSPLGGLQVTISFILS